MSLHLDVSPQVEAQLFDYARREGIDLSTLIEKMVREYRPLPTSAEDDKLGGKTLGEVYGHLLGTVSAEPSDLAKHRDSIQASEISPKNAAAIAQLQAWAQEDATDDPEEIQEAEADLSEFIQNLNRNRIESGERPLFP